MDESPEHGSWDALLHEEGGKTVVYEVYVVVTRIEL